MKYKEDFVEDYEMRGEEFKAPCTSLDSTHSDGEHNKELGFSRRFRRHRERCH